MEIPILGWLGTTTQLLWGCSDRFYVHKCICLLASTPTSSYSKTWSAVCVRARSKSHFTLIFSVASHRVPANSKHLLSYTSPKPVCTHRPECQYTHTHTCTCERYVHISQAIDADIHHCFDWEWKHCWKRVRLGFQWVWQYAAWSPLIMMTKLYFISCITTDDREPYCKPWIDAFVADPMTGLEGSNSFLGNTSKLFF